MRGFEGGQMPLHRRLPKRGFTSIFKKQWNEINLTALDHGFEASAQVTPAALVEKGMIRKLAKDGVVILGQGNVTKPLHVQAHRFSAKAKEKILAAGGTVTVIGA
jgi:large subunit ribosomal protein L15